jgi:hypothetical protein
MMYGVKMSEEAHVLLQAVWQIVKQVYIDHSPYVVLKKRWFLQCPPLFSCCLFLESTLRSFLFVTGGVKMSEEAYVWLPAVCQMVEQVYIEHTPCAVFKKWLTL